MYTYLSEKLKETEKVPENIKKDYEKFFKKISSFYYFEEKHFEKLKIFSENNDLVEYLFSLTENLEPLYETRLDFAYILLIFAYSKNENALKYLQNLTDYFIEKKTPNNRQLLEILDFAKNPDLATSLEKEKNFFQNLYKNSPYFEFIKEVGLDFSDYNFKNNGKEGWFNFSLTTIAGKEYEFQCDTEEEKKNFYKINISFFTPSGSEKCFTIDLSEPFYNISFHHWDNDYVGSNKSYVELYFKDRNENFIIKNGENLENLIETIKEIEKIIGKKFSLEKIFFSFSKGMKGKKNLENWIIEKMNI